MSTGHLKITGLSNQVSNALVTNWCRPTLVAPPVSRLIASKALGGIVSDVVTPSPHSRRVCIFAAQLLRLTRHEI